MNKFSLGNKESHYYRNNANRLGWGEQSANLDKERVELIKSYSKGEKVLDVGCGVGLYVNLLCELGYDGYGVDVVEEFIRKNRKEKKGVFLKGSAEKLPLKSKEVDTTLLFDILEHGDDIQILKEATRVTKQTLLVIVPREVDRELEQSGVIFRHYLDKSHLREYKEEDFKKLEKRTGLKLVHLQKVHPLYNETIFWVLFGGSKPLKKILRKIILLLLPKKKYYTEYFAVFEI